MRAHNRRIFLTGIALAAAVTMLIVGPTAAQKPIPQMIQAQVSESGFQDEQVDPAPIDTVPVSEDTGGEGSTASKGKGKASNQKSDNDKPNKDKPNNEEFDNDKPAGAKPNKKPKSQRHEVRPRILEAVTTAAGSDVDPRSGTSKPLAEAVSTERSPVTTEGGSGARTTAALAAAPGPVDMKILVISADGRESDFTATQAHLRQLGIPFDTLIATQSPDLTASKLWDGGVRGYYQAVILTTGNLTYFEPTTNQWQSAFTAAEWATLWDYEARFNIRQVTSYTFPYGFPDSYGLNLVTVQDTLNAPLQATLTTAGQGVFRDLNAATPITFNGAWVYLATVVNTAVTTPLITTPQGYAIASINTYPDGRQNLTVTAANNTELLHSMLLSYGVINWVTKGLFLGERHVNTGYQIDDLYTEDDIWDPAALSDQTGLTYRNNAADITAAVAWQNSIRSLPLTGNFRLEWAFNAEGASGIYVPDDLTPAVKANQAQFNFVNHTFTHRNLDVPTTAAQVTTELSRNHNFRATVPFTNYSRDSLVQPDISGLTNPQFFQAATQFGIRYIISDTSQPGWNNPTPNAGIRNPAFPSILIIPRRPSNLFYNLSTPAQWVSEFNYFYGPGGLWAYFDHPLSYQEILDYESGWLLKYLLRWDIDPLMFHTPNLRAYDGTHSLFSDLVDRTMTKYRSMVNLPVRNMTQHAIGLKMTDRMNYDQGGVTASLLPCTSLTVRATRAAKVPVTGVAFGTNREVYGSQNISYVSLAAGQSVTIPTTVC
jgi:hypothetical protein